MFGVGLALWSRLLKNKLTKQNFWQNVVFIPPSSCTGLQWHYYFNNNEHKKTYNKNMDEFMMGKPQFLFLGLPPQSPPLSKSCSFPFLLLNASWTQQSQMNFLSALLSALSHPRVPLLSPPHPLGSRCESHRDVWYSSNPSCFFLCPRGCLELLVP